MGWETLENTNANQQNFGQPSSRIKKLVVEHMLKTSVPRILEERRKQQIQKGAS